MYVPRRLAATLKKALDLFPSVLVTGPRQSGKTTFLLHEFGQRCDYVNFDDPMERNFALSDPNGFLDRFTKKPVILDEIQYAPELLPYIKMRIDHERDRAGRWLMTGSQQFALMRNVSESLAGRVAVLELLPFSLLEHKNDSLGSLFWTGRYPEPALTPEKRDLWLKSYIQTYLERDVRQVQNIRDLRMFETFLGLCAARHGQVCNMAGLSRDAGVSLPTAKAWIGVLEASYVLCLVPPYFKNYGKRLVKSPKMYFPDPALACALTRQPSPDAALAGALAGPLFEGLVISEAVKVFTLGGRKPDIFYWRSHGGLEVDLLLQIHGKLHPVEIKLTATPGPGHIKPLGAFKELAGDDAANTGILVCRAKEKTRLPHGNLALPWQEFPTWLQEELG